jgi:hypothetical protein
MSFTESFSGTQWEPNIDNIQGILLALQDVNNGNAFISRTTAPPILNQSNFGHRGVRLWLEINTAPNTAETLNIKVAEVSPVIGVRKYKNGAGFTTAAGSTMQAGGPWIISVGIGPLAEATEDNAFTIGDLARIWVPEVNPSGASAWVYGLAYSMIARG